MRNADQQLAKLPAPPVYKLKPGDILYVQLITNTPGLSSAFNNPTGNISSSQQSSEAMLYFNGYTISDSGFVSLPLIGNINVNGQSVFEARNTIQTEISKHYIDATINVKLANFRVTVVGEVRSPGVYRIYNDLITLFEALALSGDILENGNKQNVLVVRNVNNEMKSFRVNLNNADVLYSEVYYLMPNDIVVVEPTTNKVFRMNLPYITLFFSTISTALVLIKFVL